MTKKSLSPKSPALKLYDRVFKDFFFLVQPTMKINELKTRHFQLYVEHRHGQVGKQTKKPIREQTILKEVNAIRAGLRRAAEHFESLENWNLPKPPKMQKGLKRKSQRKRLVSDKEFNAIIGELMKEPTGKQKHTRFHRVRLAHTLEFALLTGLRRKEIARLKFSQFDADEKALFNVIRWKTDTVTEFFPLPRRAVEIINERRRLQEDSEFIFTPDGEPIEANYRTLKTICKDLKIPYGRYSENGFVSHDLRHNFATDILQESDVKTTRELLGHSNITQTNTYIHTSRDRLRAAVRNRDKIDYDAELQEIFEAIKNGELDALGFIAKLREILAF